MSIRLSILEIQCHLLAHSYETLKCTVMLINLKPVQRAENFGNICTLCLKTAIYYTKRAESKSKTLKELYLIYKNACGKLEQFKG